MSGPTHDAKCLINESPATFFYWLESQGVDAETRFLFEQHMVDGFTFAMLTVNDLREIGVTKVGILKKLLFLIDVWRSRHQTSCCSCLDILSGGDLDYSHYSESCRFFSDSPICELKPKIWKVIISAIYAFLSLGVNSFIMVLAHERLPDISQYPPLPDILLDNLPYIPWAFEAAEMIALCLCLIWFTVLFFHKHRLILFRRYCSLLGTVFLLRSITMIITSLSVPGKHLLTECRPFVFNSYREKFARAAEIWFGMGMTLRGVRTCGDYMFSGHTTVITMLNFFITEYTPCRLNRLHNFTWVLNVFGVFFILAAHEHYSIDVFVAIYITSRLFLYYHWQANNHHLLHCDKRRAQIWFPLLTFFESDVRGMVPHEFSNPLRQAVRLLRKRHFRWIAAPLAAVSLCFTAHSSTSVAPSVSPVTVSASPAQNEKHE
ncbi:sphingomyelin synthase protein 1 [Echinococcus multilocularis]|uniref:Sphingomyelin synthase protein 1 n=1 Tax=Echinococcus multilocularis TaxID=6211 RepID=A0A087W1J5_ECHMU|nr:sphingomyelin synthase protein 1 [Echinococcus multilocularis]